MLLATFSGLGGSVDGQHSERAIRHIFSIFDASGDGLLDEDEFLAVVPLLGEVVGTCQVKDGRTRCLHVVLREVVS